MNLKKVLFKKNKHLHVDWDYLKTSYENGYLEGADVFARLFGILHDGLFATEKKDEYNLEYYDIYIEDWVLFFSFIRNGYITNSYSLEKNVSNLNYCYDICIKFGGVPKFESYYNSFFNNKNNDASHNVYNPMTPMEDIKVMYTWRVINTFTVLKSNESVTACISNEPTTTFYCRKPVQNQVTENND